MLRVLAGEFSRDEVETCREGFPGASQGCKEKFTAPEEPAWTTGSADRHFLRIPELHLACILIEAAKDLRHECGESFGREAIGQFLRDDESLF